jgi:exodeoxyribonuclease VII small subunit
MTSSTNNFEAALLKLGEIVQRIDAGELQLDEAIKQYEEGVKLIKLCHDFLAKAEQKVEILAKELESSTNSGDKLDA